MKLSFSQHCFEKYWNIIYHKNPPSGSRVVPCGQGGQTYEANSRFSQFCKRA